VLGADAGLAFGAGLVARERNDGMLARRLPPVADVRERIDVGVPSPGQQVARQSVRVAIVVVVFAAGGGAGLAAYLLGARVAAVAFVPAIGLQQAAQSVVGQNLGAGAPDRARRAAWLGVALITGALAVIGAVQWVVPGPIVTALAPDLGSEATALSETYLRVLAYGYPAIGAAYLLEGV
jgi:Na+-driven multidrug efflux pump